MKTALFFSLLVACATAGHLLGDRPAYFSTKGCPGGGGSSSGGDSEGPSHTRTYRLSDDKLSWHDAEAACVSLGGHLASCHDDETEALFQSLVSGEDAWIGLHDPSTDETGFEWVDGSCVVYESWAPGEPNESGSEDCVHIAWSWSLGGGWNDQSCDTHFRYICEYVDYCDSNDCSPHAACTNHEEGYTCACNSGYHGDGHVCTDIDECASSPCSPDATCTNTDGGHECACNSGYHGDGVTCTDIDECASSPCAPDATCTNTPGGHECACNSGFTGDGVTCTDVNECSSNPCSTLATCVNTHGGHTCTCKSGYYGDGVTCSDKDECTNGDSTCSGDAACYNTVGSYYCLCNAGYLGDGRSCSLAACDIGSAGTAPSCGTCSASGYQGTSSWDGSSWTACSVKDSMAPGEGLHEGKDLLSANKDYRLSMQTDGNLVLYGPSGAGWNSGTHGKCCSPYKADLQTDGNFVVYGSSGALWSSGTSHADGIVMQNDGNLVIYNSGSAQWASNDHVVEADVAAVAKQGVAAQEEEATGVSSAAKVFAGVVAVAGVAVVTFNLVYKSRARATTNDVEV